MDSTGLKPLVHSTEHSVLEANEQGVLDCTEKIDENKRKNYFDYMNEDELEALNDIPPEAITDELLGRIDQLITEYSQKFIPIINESIWNEILSLSGDNIISEFLQQQLEEPQIINNLSEIQNVDGLFEQQEKQQSNGFITGTAQEVIAETIITQDHLKDAEEEAKEEITETTKYDGTGVKEIEGIGREESGNQQNDEIFTENTEKEESKHVTHHREVDGEAKNSEGNVSLYSKEEINNEETEGFKDGDPHKVGTVEKEAESTEEPKEGVAEDSSKENHIEDSPKILQNNSMEEGKEKDTPIIADAVKELIHVKEESKEEGKDKEKESENPTNEEEEIKLVLEESDKCEEKEKDSERDTEDTPKESDTEEVKKVPEDDKEKPKEETNEEEIARKSAPAEEKEAEKSSISCSPAIGGVVIVQMENESEDSADEDIVFRGFVSEGGGGAEVTEEDAEMIIAEGERRERERVLEELKREYADLIALEGKAEAAPKPARALPTKPMSKSDSKSGHAAEEKEEKPAETEVRKLKLPVPSESDDPYSDDPYEREESPTKENLRPKKEEKEELPHKKEEKEELPHKKEDKEELPHKKEEKEELPHKKEDKEELPHKREEPSLDELVEMAERVIAAGEEMSRAMEMRAIMLEVDELERAEALRRAEEEERERLEAEQHRREMEAEERLREENRRLLAERERKEKHKERLRHEEEEDEFGIKLYIEGPESVSSEEPPSYSSEEEEPKPVILPLRRRPRIDFSSAPSLRFGPPAFCAPEELISEARERLCTSSTRIADIMGRSSLHTDRISMMSRAAEPVREVKQSDIDELRLILDRESIPEPPEHRTSCPQSSLIKILRISLGTIRRFLD